MMVSPLRAGANSSSYTVSTVEPPPHHCSPMMGSIGGSASIFVLYPPGQAHGSPPLWARKWVTEQFKCRLCYSSARRWSGTRSKSSGHRDDGDAEALWAVQLVGEGDEAAFDGDRRGTGRCYELLGPPYALGWGVADRIRHLYRPHFQPFARIMGISL